LDIVTVWALAGSTIRIHIITASRTGNNEPGRNPTERPFNRLPLNAYNNYYNLPLIFETTQYVGFISSGRNGGFSVYRLTLRVLEVHYALRKMDRELLREKDEKTKKKVGGWTPLGSQLSKKGYLWSYFMSCSMGVYLMS
jgi:hypothetical protein